MHPFQVGVGANQLFNPEDEAANGAGGWFEWTIASQPTNTALQFANYIPGTTISDFAILLSGTPATPCVTPNPCDNVISVKQVLNTKTNCGTATPYVMYFNGNYYTAGSDLTFTEYTNGTACLKGSVQRNGLSFNVNVIYSGKTTTAPALSPKFELCATAANTHNAGGWCYYTNMSGTVATEGGVCDVVRRGPSFQLGTFGNLQENQFGGSGWFSCTNNASVGDFNFNIGSTVSCNTNGNVSNVCKTYNVQNVIDNCGCAVGMPYAVAIATTSQGFCPGIRCSATNLIFKQNGDGTASITGTVTEANGRITTINVNLTGETSTAPSGSPKLELCNAANTPSDGWIYYTGMTGTMTTNGQTLTLTRRGPAFQVGIRANGQNANFGGSGWFTLSDGREGDFNFDFTNGTDCTDPCLTDSEAPVLSACPQNISLTTTVSPCAMATWTAPTATDNCGTPSVSSNYNTNYCFPVGSTTVIYTATDDKNNKSTCSFTVTVTKPATAVCDAITIASPYEGTISLSGLTGTTTVQVFTNNWTSVYNQIVSTPSVSVPNLGGGNYIVKVQLYNTSGNWALICEKMFNINVVGAVQAPVANDDNATTPQDTPVTIDVLGNDNLNGGTNPTLMIVSQSPDGTASIENGQIVFTPNAGFSGTTTFTYKITASNGTSNVATVTVVVPAADVPPVANDDNATTPQNTEVIIDVLSNDTLKGGTNPVILIVSQSIDGIATVVNGQVVFTPNAGFFGTTTFTYIVTASNGTSNIATVTVVVPPTVVPPVANDDSTTTPQDSPVIIDVLGNDNLNGGTNPTIMIVSQSADGIATVENGQIVFSPNAGFTGITTFTYMITTSDGTSNIATVKVTIESTDPCVINPVATPTTTVSNATNGGANGCINITNLTTDASSSINGGS